MAILLPEKIKSDALNLSVSKVKTFKDCKAKFRYAYIEKLPQKEWEFLAFGKFLHEVLEHFHKEVVEEPDHIRMTRIFKESLKEWAPKLTKESLQECKNIIASYLKHIKVNSINVIEVEKPFYIDIDGKILLNGFIDRIQLDQDGVVHVSDYKTTKNKKYLKNDFFQLQTYAFVLLLENPELEKIRTSYKLLRHNFESIVKEFSREEILRTEGIFLKWAAEISDEKLFRATPTPLCAYCSYNDGVTCLDAYKTTTPSPVNAKFGETDW